MQVSDLPGAIIGYRKDGRPIRLIAGGDPSNDPTEPTDPAANVVSMTQEQLDKLLSDARGRAYSKAEKATQQNDELKAEVARLAKVEADRAKIEKKATDEAAALRKQAEEAEMGARELIERRSAELQAKYDEQANEWASRYQGLESQMAAREAVFEKERAFQQLAVYTNEQVNAHADDLIPELATYITGNSPEEIDASLQLALQKSAAIISGVQGAQTAAASRMPGVSTGGFAPTGPLEGQGGQRVLTPEEIHAMPMDEFGANRAALGVTGGNVGSGRFGHLGKGLLG